MKRRTMLLGGAAAAGAVGAYASLPDAAKVLLGNYRIGPGRIPILIERVFGWKGSDFLAGGTTDVKLDALPVPRFRERPNCVATLANIVGPCDTVGVPIRIDVSEGRAGLPTRMSLRVVNAATCQPYSGAEVQLWHAGPKGIYSGKDVRSECTFDDADAISGLAFRGRQMTDGEGVVNFLSVYPGWYKGRCIHVHIRVVVGGRDVLVSQLLFDDLLSDAIHADHPDYTGRPARDTRNDADYFSPRAHLNDHMFDFDRLDGGVLQASYTIGVAA